MTFLSALAAQAQQTPPAMLDMPCSAARTSALYPRLKRFVPEQGPPGVQAKVRAAVLRTVTWKPGETLKICFLSGTKVARSRVARFASEWMEHANIVLDFGDRASPRSCSGDNHEAVKIDFVGSGPKGGNWSALGTLSRRAVQSMNLANLGSDSLPLNRSGQPMPEREARRLVLHEFGHALGLLHEHQSPTSNCGREYDEEAIMAYGSLLGWPPAAIVLNFQQMAESAEINASEIDRKSIMHYSMPAWIFKEGRNSACHVPTNFELSAGDKDFMRRTYPKADPPDALGDASAKVATRGSIASSQSPKRKLEDYEKLLREAGLPAEQVRELVTDLRNEVFAGGQ
ncbi:MAG: hypothetical protein NW223_10465 [Hyphomicrobiaceae bacterium]|nr:hypothetical protein [Hyphomicrobiaceae bacterium]